jgi:hypothetical protein
MSFDMTSPHIKLAQQQFPRIDWPGFITYVVATAPGEVDFAEQLIAKINSHDLPGLLVFLSTAAPSQIAVFLKLLSFFRAAQPPVGP